MLAVIRNRTRVLPSSGLPVRPRRLAPLGAMAAAVVLLGAIGHPITARAGSLVVEVVPANTNVTAGSAGTLELDLLNTSSTQSFNVAGFQFELQVPSNSGVLFTNATTSTTAATYIFAGNSIADSFFGGSLIVSPPPPPATSDLQGFDTVATSGTFTTLNPGNSFGLGLISFTVGASAASGIVPVSIIPFDINTAPNGTLDLGQPRRLDPIHHVRRHDHDPGRYDRGPRAVDFHADHRRWGRGYSAQPGAPLEGQTGSSHQMRNIGARAPVV